MKKGRKEQSLKVNKGSGDAFSAIGVVISILILKVIAEGVETINQVEFLMEKNCEAAQGYYFYRPLPQSEILNILKD